MNEMKISVNGKMEMEKLILINIIGLMDSLSIDAISIEESETYLFSPYSIDKLRTLNLDEQIVELIEKGCELEDIESLIPEKLHTSINEIRLQALDILKKLPESEEDTKKWLD